MRLVLDTNIVLSALLWHGAPSRLMRAAANQEVLLFTSAPMLTELTRVLSKDKFRGKLASSAVAMDRMIESYVGIASLVVPATIPRVVSDPDDDVVVATAIAAGADFLVTGDNHLLLIARYVDVQITTIGNILAVLDAV